MVAYEIPFHKNLSYHLSDSCISRICLILLLRTLEDIEGLQLLREGLDGKLWLIFRQKDITY